MPIYGDDATSLLPATLLRNTICADARLSKKASALLRKECDAMAAVLVTSASLARGELGGPIEPHDLWEALLANGRYAWLVERLGLWRSPGIDGGSQIPPDVPLPLPPDGLTPDGRLLPHLVWRRSHDVVLPATSSAAPGERSALPMHEALLEPAPASAVTDGVLGSISLHSAFLEGGATGRLTCEPHSQPP